MSVVVAAADDEVQSESEQQNRPGRLYGEDWSPLTLGDLGSLAAAAVVGTVPSFFKR